MSETCARRHPRLWIDIDQIPATSAVTRYIRSYLSEAALARILATTEQQVPFQPSKVHSVLAIYPTAHKVEDLLKRESLAHGCLLGHRLTTFPQVIETLWREAGIARVMLGPIGERLALEEAITRARARGVPLAFVPGVGVREHILRFIRELKSAAIEPAILTQASAGLSERAAIAGGIAEIFAEYDQVLRDTGTADAHDRERLVVGWLHELEESGQRPRFLNDVRRLLVAEVYDPSLVQFMLVSSLIRLVGDATLTIQAEPFDLRISRFADLTWDRFVAEESISDKVLPHFVRRDGRKGRLGFVLTHLFAEAAPRATGDTHLTSTVPDCSREKQEAVAVSAVPPEDDTVRVIEAPNVSREAEEVARSVRRMLELPAANAVALDRIAVVARNLHAYGDHLEAAFRRYRIPLNIFRRRSLSAFAPAQVVRDILRIPGADYHRDSLLSLCRAPFLHFTAARFETLPALAGYIDRKTRPLAVCIETRQVELRRTIERESGHDRADALRRRLAYLDLGAQAWNQLLDALATLELPAALGEYVTKVLRVLDSLGFDPARDSLTDSAAAAAGPLRSALETLASEARIVSPRRRVTLAEFASAVDQLLDDTTVEPTANRSGSVRAMSVTDARGLDFDVVFIVGLNEGVFPAYRGEDALLPDDVMRKLNAPLKVSLRQKIGRFAPDAPGPILRTHHDHNAEEPFLFFLAMSMPACRVVLSYSAADGNGTPLAVSPFVTEVSGILNGVTPQRINAAEFIPPAIDCFAPEEFLARAALESALPNASLPVESIEIESVLRRTEIERGRDEYLALPCREELVDERRRQLSRSQGEQWLGLDLSPDHKKLADASGYDGRIRPRSALEQFLLKGPDHTPRKWSAAQLTELASCGYKFFARRILLLREAEEADYEQTALETGTLVHDILCAIFNQAGRSDAASLRLFERRLLDEFHHVEHAGARDPAFFEIEWASVEAMVHEIIEYEIAGRAGSDAATEMHHELPLNLLVGRKSPDDSTGELEIALEGKIDRLEIYRDGGHIRRLKLIDYKSSHRLGNYAELLRPSHFACDDLQMPVYGLGALERFRSEMSPEAIVEMSYIALKNRDKETVPQQIPLAVLDSRLASAESKTVAARILNLIDAAAAGHFEVDPLKCSEYCPYRRVCRYREPVFHS